MSKQANDIGYRLNRETPYAPTDAEEVNRRLLDKRQPSVSEVKGTADREENRPGTVTDAVDTGGADNLRVYVPTAPYDRSKTGSHPVLFEVRQLEGGSASVPVFTTEEQLVDELGDGQAYVAIPIIHLLRQVAGRAPVVIDPVLMDGVAKRTSDLNPTVEEDG